MLLWEGRTVGGQAHVPKPAGCAAPLGPSRITQLEQIDFLRRLHAQQMPVSVRSRQLTKSLRLLENRLRHRLYGKTGWSNPGHLNNNGWFVGWLEQANGAVYFFAFNLEPDPGQFVDQRFIAGRRLITEQILAELGVLKK